MTYDAAEVALAQVTVGVATLREYVGTDCYRHLMALLEALRTSYMHDMVYVTPEALAFKQGALRQVMALLNAIDGPVVDSPKV